MKTRLLVGFLLFALVSTSAFAFDDTGLADLAVLSRADDVTYRPVATIEVSHRASKALKSVENEFEKRQTNHDNVYQDDGEAAVDNSKAVVSPRVVDHWNSYYDFLINEGSYKFWAIFQLATAALLIYSGFAALYYAKINPQFNEDTDEDLLFRKRRRRRSIGEKHRPSRDRPFFGLDPQVLQRIIDAVATEFH